MTPEQLTTILSIFGIAAFAILCVECVYWRRMAKRCEESYYEAMEGWKETLAGWRKEEELYEKARRAPKLPPNVPVTPISDERAAVRQMR